MKGAPQWMVRGLRREPRQAAAVEAVKVKIVPLRERIHSMVIDPALMSGPASDQTAAPALLDTPAPGDHSVA